MGTKLQKVSTATAYERHDRTMRVDRCSVDVECLLLGGVGKGSVLRFGLGIDEEGILFLQCD